MSAPDDNDPRRRFDLQETNPFINFRHLADHLASSVLDAVFTLPAQIAESRRAHDARELCRTGRASERLCDTLRAFEEESAKCLEEYREQYRKGDWTGVIEAADDLMESNDRVEECREKVLRQSSSSSAGAANNALLEKVGNEKGEQWGAEWDWDIPKPFDARNRRELSEPESLMQWFAGLEPRHRHFMNLLGLDQPIWAQPSHPYSSFDAHYPEAAKVGSLGDGHGPWRDAFEDLLRIERGQPLMPQSRLGQSNNMSHEQWRRRFWDIQDRNFIAAQRRRFPLPAAFDHDDEDVDEDVDEELHYEYSHDHEDQHDEPPSPRTKQGQWSQNSVETELDAYERFLGPMSTAGEGRPSILSTMTTTERTIAPDGTITTKVVLKKRFPDGREETSETVTKQRSEDLEAQHSDAWSAMPEERYGAQNKSQEGTSKRSGWFWSS